jgi:glycosyltransferase involved in cell wall biosynthesis
MSPQVVTVSFRLGGNDGVSVEAQKWEWALHQLGFETRRVAGEIEDDGQSGDIVIPELRIEPAGDAGPFALATLRAALTDADLLVVDNICSLPLNVEASRAVARIAAEHRGRVLFRHHDLPWQRRHLTHFGEEFPPRAPEGALHTTVNLRSRRELEARGFEQPVTVHNHFDFDSPHGERETTRAAFGFDPDDIVVFQPARAIERKNVPGGVLFSRRLAALLPDRTVRYWLSGPAEDGYAPTLERVLAKTAIPVTLGRAARSADAYAASDLVVLPSTWEGFGNPTIESIWARRACAAFPYPVLREILATGVRLFSTERAEAMAKFLTEPEPVRDQFFDVNVHRARLSFDLQALPGAIEQTFISHGWTSW